MPKHTLQTAQSEEGDGTDDPCGPFKATLFSNSGGLTQFGCFLETLPPGSASSVKHWHAREDEMIYMISGIATVTEGDEEYLLAPGEAATFKAGVPKGHCLTNRSDAPISYLVIGTRYDRDTVTYPDNDRVLRTRRAADGSGTVTERVWTTLHGASASGLFDDAGGT